MDKIKRIAQFEELENLFAQGVYDDLPDSPAQVIKPKNILIPKNNSGVYTGDIDFQKTNIISSLHGTLATKKAVLVFCSAKNPGGGVKRGSLAQEEEIALHSNWYFKVKDTQGFYLETKDSAFNTDNMLYVEKGYLLKDENFKDIDPFPIAFIGATAVNLNGMLSQNKSVVLPKVYESMAQRIENILKLAQDKKITHLYLGAWGCGVFGLDPQKIATIFREKITENHYRGNISFVIKEPDMLEIFRKELKCFSSVIAVNKFKLKK